MKDLRKRLALALESASFPNMTVLVRERDMGSSKPRSGVTRAI